MASMKRLQLYQSIGLLIRARREHFGFSQQKLADLVGLSRASITNIEAGRQRIFVDQLVSISDLLKIELSDVEQAVFHRKIDDGLGAGEPPQEVKIFMVNARSRSSVFDG